jgi:Flp pilus assembly protein TadG
MRHHRTNTNDCRHRPRRRATAAAELIIAFPILVGFLLGTIEFSIAFQARQQLLTAVREGARVGSQGGTKTEVITTVQQLFTQTAIPTQNITVLGTVDLSPYQPEGSTGRDAVQVCATVNTTDVVPNLIPFLIDLKNETLSVCVVMNLEAATP